MPNRDRNPFENLRAALTAVVSWKNRTQTVAMKQLEADMKERVFNDGKAADGSSIGHYSIKPLYATQDEFSVRSKFKPQGKNSSSQYFQTGNKRKSQYVPGGYKELRAIQGFSTETVNLDYTGSLRHSITVGTVGTNVVLGFADKERFEIAEGNEGRFHKEIFTPSKRERETVTKVVFHELDKIFNEFGF